MSKDLWNEKMETISREELEKIRLERLGVQLKYCYSHSEYYKKKFDEVGFKPEDINSWEDFRKLPVLMNKEDERASQQESMERFAHPFGMHLCTAPEKIISANATTGTTGLPTFSYSFTKKDLDTLIEGMCRVYWIVGFRPGDRILYAFPISGGISTSGGLWTNPLRHMGCLPLEIGAEAGIERVLRMATLANPTVLMASPSFAMSLAEKCKEVTGKEIKELGFKKLLLTGEPGIGIPAVRGKMENLYGAKWYEFAGPMGETLCGSCDAEQYQGIHEVIPESHVYLEDLVDPVTKKPIEVQDGAAGEGIFTSLYREGMPYIKYAYGDIIHIFTKPCECGYPGPGYRYKILGRVDDMLVVDGTMVLPSMVKNAVTSFVPRVTGEMRIVLTEKPPYLQSPLKLKLEHGPDIVFEAVEDLSREIKVKIQRDLNIPCEIEFLPPGALERSAWKTPIFDKKYV